MPICKLKLVFASALIYSNVFAFGQMKMPEMPSMTNISDGPSMPHISAPTIGAKFYVPGMIYNQKKEDAAVKKAEEAPVKTNVAADSVANTAKQITSILGVNNSRLTATDVSALGSSGMFGGIYELLGNDASIGSNGYSSTASTDIILQRIMSQLEDLKSQNEKLRVELNNAKSLNQENGDKSYLTASQMPPKEALKPKILRFYVNGYNVLDTCRTVYFSQKEMDGSFLLTGDRKYTTDNKSRDETFYLLFKADGNCGTAAGFDVEPKVVQDYKNEYSFLYQLSQKHNLKADKTGNLVALRCLEPGWNMDLLLDIGSE